MRAAVDPAASAREYPDHGTDRHTPGTAAQKQSLHASERDTERVQQARADYQEAVATLDPQRFTCIDESGVNLAMTRLDGRAPRGERVIGAVPQNDGAHATRLAALGSQGVEAVMTIDGATDAAVFRLYVARVLRPTLCQGDIVIMDNLRAHKTAGIREAIEQAGAQLWSLPPYSPDLAPIERCWSKLKSLLRAAKAARGRRWPPSPSRMHEAGSKSVDMPDSDSRTALLIRT
jgi:transposase